MPRKEKLQERQFFPDEPIEQEAKRAKLMTPWGAESLDEFLFYCCPECPNKFKESESFLDHAKNHENSNLELETMPMVNGLPMDTTSIVVSSETPLRIPGLIPMTVKEEESLSNDDIDPLSCEMDEIKEELPQEDKTVSEEVTCQLCRKTCKNKNGLTQHLKLAHPNKVETFDCEHCGEKYTTKGKLNRHVRKVHLENSTMCDKCDFVGKSKKDLKSHSHTHRFTKLPDGRFHCNECSRIFDNTYTLHQHIHFRCDICSFTCVGSHSFDTHMVVKHGKSFDCEQCQEKFVDRKRLKQHVREAHSTIPKKLKCDQCDAVCSGQEQLRIHLQHHTRFTKLTDGRFQCKECDMIMEPPPNSKLSSHNHYHCDICSYSTIKKCALEIHKHQKHSIDLPPNYHSSYMCEMCDYVTMNIGNLKKHQESVHREETEMCYICGKEFKSGSLYMHLRTKHHEEGMTVSCDICHKTMKPYILKSHMKNYHTHYICTICNKVLTAPRNLCNHYSKEHQVNSVPGEKFACHVCKKPFKEMEEFQRHLKEEHQIFDEHPCTKCELKFQTEAILAIHLMDAHNYTEENVAVLFGTAQKVVKHFTERDTFQFQCDICHAKLKTEKSLIRHNKQIHEKHKHNIKCDQCDFVTSEDNLLKVHIITKHEKATKYPCDQCSYVTNIRSALKQHVERQHERKFNFSCDVCGKEFSSLRFKAQHMLFKHNIVFEYQKSNNCGP